MIETSHRIKAIGADTKRTETVLEITPMIGTTMIVRHRATVTIPMDIEVATRSHNANCAEIASLTMTVMNPAIQNAAVSDGMTGANVVVHGPTTTDRADNLQTMISIDRAAETQTPMNSALHHVVKNAIPHEALHGKIVQGLRGMLDVQRTVGRIDTQEAMATGGLHSITVTDSPNPIITDLVDRRRGTADLVPGVLMVAIVMQLGMISDAGNTKVFQHIGSPDMVSIILDSMTAGTVITDSVATMRGMADIISGTTDLPPSTISDRDGITGLVDIISLIMVTADTGIIAGGTIVMTSADLRLRIGTIMDSAGIGLPAMVDTGSTVTTDGTADTTFLDIALQASAISDRDNFMDSECVQECDTSAAVLEVPGRSGIMVIRWGTIRGRIRTQRSGAERSPRTIC
jgi:hypothetical protein